MDRRWVRVPKFAATITRSKLLSRWLSTRKTKLMEQTAKWHCKIVERKKQFASLTHIHKLKILANKIA